MLLFIIEDNIKELEGLFAKSIKKYQSKPLPSKLRKPASFRGRCNNSAGSRGRGL